jgi:hypothetical protein
MTHNKAPKTDKPDTPRKEDESEKPTEVEAFLIRLFRELLLNGRRLGVGGALVAALGMSGYSSFAPETEARTSYELLRPIVQATANDLIKFQAELAATQEEQAEIEALIRELIKLYEADRMRIEAQMKDQRRYKRSSSDAPSFVDATEQKMQGLVEKLNQLSHSPAAAIPNSMVELPNAPWEK